MEKFYNLFVRGKFQSYPSNFANFDVLVDALTVENKKKLFKVIEKNANYWYTKYQEWKKEVETSKEK